MLFQVHIAAAGQWSASLERYGGFVRPSSLSPPNVITSHQFVICQTIRYLNYTTFVICQPICYLNYTTFIICQPIHYPNENTSHLFIICQPFRYPNVITSHLICQPIHYPNAITNLFVILMLLRYSFLCGSCHM